MLLDLWERGASRHPLDRALLLASSTDSAVTMERLADEPLAVRDQRLVRALLTNFGPEIAAWIDCPTCGTRLEFALDARTLLDSAGADDVTIDGVRVRRPSSRDLAAALAEPDEAARARRLAERCVEAGDAVVSTALMARAEEALAAADSAGDPQLDFTCDACGETWQDPFDVAGYLWRQVETRARHLLGDVDVLARVYGWTEADVLALSDARRAAYVEMAGA